MSEQLRSYRCPFCSSALSRYSLSSDNDSLEGDLIKCSTCHIQIPVVNGIFYFTESDNDVYLNDDSCFDRVKDVIIEKRPDYRNFMRVKQWRKTLDPYSAFQPFNESSRSIYPFLHLISANLKAGDVIIDTWCRTGWSSLFLAGLFPNQKVISIWEGNKDTLGYQGFDFWLGKTVRPTNLEIVFHDLNKPLPFQSDTASFIYGLDTLHRYDQKVLVPELLRVLKDDGILIFPHIHLTNSEPEPFFERGERQLHGMAYESYFRKVLAGRGHKAFVLSEPEMFSLAQPTSIVSDPGTRDYNAMIAILPDKLTGKKLRPFDYKKYSADELRILVNPFFVYDLSNQAVTLDREHLNGMVGHMMDRHPVYIEKVQSTHGFKLTEAQARIIYLSQHGYSVSQLIEKFEFDSSEIFVAIDELIEKDILQVLPISEQGVLLQQYHSKQAVNTLHSDHTIAHLLPRASLMYSDQPVIINSQDDSKISFEEANALTEAIQARLRAAGLKKGSLICISSKPHFEAILVYWAATGMGVKVSIINSSQPLHIKEDILREAPPSIVFADTELRLRLETHVVVFDNEEIDIPSLFSNWLQDDFEVAHSDNEELMPDDVATILYTSGSTAKPKGIELVNSALYESGKLLAESYHWKSSDRILMSAELDSMSGLRNVCIAPLFAGVTIVIPKTSSNNTVLSLMDEIQKHEVTILTATPALISQILKIGMRAKAQISSVSRIICTGASLPPTLIQEFHDMFAIPIYNYYGLTETTGFCLGEPIDKEQGKEGSIGIEIDAIAQIVDDHNDLVVPGETGNLRIYSDRHMKGYLTRGESNLVLKDGWLYTGDLAMRDRDGYYYLKGRKRDMIKNESGEIVYFKEVEECLSKYEGIQDALVGSMSDKGQEYLVAFYMVTDQITQKPTDQELKLHLSNQLGKGKVPRTIIEVEQFILNQRGKIDKKEMMATLNAGHHAS
ncbi:MAG: class I adenylate-forming enzyme family protein [Imperialibacter sp.]|uniref:class I adenylate-forming enzyme family protein n=1 Tax=Imperialibacter sp. TaxID=2038411 RepID=UPI003A862F5B